MLLARFAFACLIIANLDGCAYDVTVRRNHPPRASSLVNTTGVTGQQGEESSFAAVSAYLRVLNANPGKESLDADHRAARQAATADLIDLYAATLLTSPDHTLRFSDASGHSLRLRLRRGAGSGGVSPSLFTRLEPADRFTIVGRPHVASLDGEGVPLVGTLQPFSPIHVAGPAPSQPIVGTTWSVTAVPMLVSSQEASERTLCIDLYDPHVTGKLPGKGGQTLASDYTIPSAVVYSRLSRQRLGLQEFLSGKAGLSSTGIYPTEEPSADKIPLVLVHGLISDPTDFYSLLSNLEDNAEFRRRYQVWVFYYPTSLPVIYSAMLLREDLELFIHQLDPSDVHPALHHAVLVGHSMGGLLSRAAITDGGPSFYRHFFSQPPSSLELTVEERDLVRRAFFYRACPDVAQVVFVATPHRGSRLAVGALGSIGRLLVRLPLDVQRNLSAIVSDNRSAVAPGVGLKPPSSLDTLSPNDPFVLALNDLPMRPSVQLHSILGNGGHEGPRESSSDGVVPYASSHLPQAQSEVLVPAGHTGSLKRPETAAEIIRIATQNKR